MPDGGGCVNALTFVGSGIVMVDSQELIPHTRVAKFSINKD